MAKKIVVELKNNMTKEVLAAMKDQIENAMKAIGSEAEGYAKDDCPVDTGRLRNSICWATHEIHATGDERDTPLGTPEEKSVYIGTNVEYAIYVEYGDQNHNVGKKHFLKDALANHSDHYKAILEAALKS